MLRLKSGLALLLLAIALTFGANPTVWAQESELSRFKDLEGKIDIAGGTAHIPLPLIHKLTIMSGFFLQVSY